jgi:hypothetical protein
MPSPRAHPLAVSRSARLANRAIEAIWRTGIDQKPPLEPDYLWKIGAKGFGDGDERSARSDEDVADFRLRVARLCASLNDEAALNAFGHTMAYGQLTAAIRKRHALGRLWRERPELLEGQIAAPIIVVGQMRSGTTRIHRLLAADPAHAGTRFCDSFDPVPKRFDYRPLKAAAALTIARRINPWLGALHPFGATRADEEIGWLSAALSPCAYEAQWRIPSFVAWSEARDPSPTYREFARILRSDTATRRNAQRRRVLKCPQFAEDMPSLFKQFPTALTVVARRRSDAVLESSVSLVSSQAAFQSDARDLAAIRLEWERKLALRDRRMTSALEGHTGAVALADFTALSTNWREAIAEIYRQLGLELTSDALTAMDREHQNRSHSATVVVPGLVPKQGQAARRPIPGTTEPTRVR